MKKYTLCAILFAGTLFSCSSDPSSNEGDGTGESAEKVELTYSITGESENKLENAKGSVRENHGNTILSFEGDNGDIEIYVASEALEVKEYVMDLNDMSAKNVLASYSIKADEGKGYCCGVMDGESSSGSITITAINDGMVTGKINAKGYDGSSIVGTFSVGE